jgi:hypothetical protein
MPGNSVRIHQLRLRIPGLSAEEGRALGADVARRVAEAIGPHVRREQLGRLDVRISAPAGTSRDRLASMVAERIVRALE